ncbi:hypothetical protein BHE74_00035354 [Ensete ventricosum]|nr:hypothetical protein BHE74_00035354 [Ensete ventricosum]
MRSRRIQNGGEGLRSEGRHFRDRQSNMRAPHPDLKQKKKKKKKKREREGWIQKRRQLQHQRWAGSRQTSGEIGRERGGDERDRMGLQRIARLLHLYATSYNGVTCLPSGRLLSQIHHGRAHAGPDHHPNGRAGGRKMGRPESAKSSLPDRGGSHWLLQ